MKLTADLIDRIELPVSGRKYITDSTCAGLTLEISARGKRLLDVYQRRNGRKVREVLGVWPAITIEEAIVLSKARKMSQFNVRTPVNVRARVMSIVQQRATQEPQTLQPLVDSYLATHVAGLSVSSQKLYKSMLKLLTHQHPYIEDISMRALRIQVDQIGATGKKVKANRFIAVTSSFLQWCFEREYVDSNAARGLRRYKEVPASRCLSEAELTTLSEALKTFKGQEDIELYIRIALVTLARSSEIEGMKWSEIDGDTWVIPAGRTKSGREHLIHLPSGLLGERKARGKVLDCTSESVRQALKRIAKQQGIPHFSNHDLRRTGSTLLAKEGIGAETRARLLNHSIGGVTERHYNCHDFRKEKEEASRLLWAVLTRTGIL